MSFRIAYFRDGVEIGRVPCPKPVSEIRGIAKAGLKRFGATQAHVFDAQGKLIEIVQVDEA